MEDEEFAFEHCRGGRFIYKGILKHYSEFTRWLYHKVEQVISNFQRSFNQLMPIIGLEVEQLNGESIMSAVPMLKKLKNSK